MLELEAALRTPEFQRAYATVLPEGLSSVSPDAGTAIAATRSTRDVPMATANLAGNASSTTSVRYRGRPN
jgi:hypothetical protein